MQISLGRPMVAGAVAAVGAAAIATVPAPAPVLGTRTADVVLAAIDNPVQQLILSGQLTQNYLLAPYYNGGDSPTPGAGEANWPYAGFDQTGGDVLNYLLSKEISLGYYSAVGLLSQVVTDNFPVLRQWGLNLFDYANVGLTGVADAALALNNGIWSLPVEAAHALQLAFGGQIDQAFTVLVNAIVTPVTDAIAALNNAADYIVSRVAARAVAAASEISNIVVNLAGSITGGIGLLADQTAAIVSEVVTQLGAGQFQNAWNAAVDGLFGPSGLPGTLLNMTIGPGIQTGPILNPETDIKTNFLPSIRTDLQAGGWLIQNALTAQPAATAAVRAVAPAAATRTAAPRPSRPAASRAVAQAPAPAAAKPGKAVRAARSTQ